MRQPMPRDAGGSIEITEGTGPIRAIISTGDALFAFKVDKTFKVETPETIDPDRTNPNAPFTVSIFQNVGTSNWIVARVLLQGDQVLSVLAGTQAEKDAIRKQLNTCKEFLLRSEACAAEVRAKIFEILDNVKHSGVKLERGRVLKPFPHVDNLEPACSTFLVEANRAIKAISGLPSLFVKLEKTDSNFDHLGERLAKKLGENAALTKFVRSNSKGICRIVNLRNYLEHPKERRTVIYNFRLSPDGKSLSPPSWHLSDEPSRVQIAEEMTAIIDFLVRVLEKLLIHLVMHRGEQTLSFKVHKIADHEIDQDFPIKYQLQASLKALRKPE